MSITSTAMTLSVSSLASYPDPAKFTSVTFPLQIDDEVMVCTALSTLPGPVYQLTVLRGQDGTTATSHSSGAPVVPSARSGAVYDALGVGVLSPGSTFTVADAISSLISAVNAGGGGRIVFPAQTYPLLTGLIAQAGVELHLMKGAWLQKNYSVTSGNALVQNPVDGSGNAIAVSGFALTGEGKLGCQDLSHGGDIVSLYGDDMRFEGVTVDTYSGGLAFVVGGSRIRMRRVTVRNSAVATGNGGIRMFGGSNFVALGCHVESGDDALQFVPLAKSIIGPFANFSDMSISRSAYIGCTGFSSAARFMVASLTDGNPKLPNAPMAGSITDCSFVGCHGAGTDRRIVVENVSSSGAISDLAFSDCSVGSYALLGVLLAPISSAATSMSVQETGTVVPTAPFTVQIGAEQVTVGTRTPGSGSQATYGSLTRGVGAVAHSAWVGVVSALAAVTPSTSAEIHIDPGNTVGGTIENVRFRGVRVDQPHYGAAEVVVPNAKVATLHSPVGSGATSISVDLLMPSGVQEFLIPTPPPFVIEVDSEQMNVTAVSGTGNPYTWTVVPGYNGTTTASHSLGASVLIVSFTTSVGALDSSTTATATSITVDESDAFQVPAATPFVILIDSEQMYVSDRTLVSGAQYTYTVVRGYNNTLRASHSAAANILLVRAASVSNIAFDGCEFAPGNLDGTATQLSADGTTGVTLRSCVFGPQPSGGNVTLFGVGTAKTHQTLKLLIDGCSFPSLGANVIAVNCNDVTRPSIQRSSFTSSESSSYGVRLGPSTSGALVEGNDMSALAATVPVNDQTNSQDTICRENLGVTDRRVVRTVTPATPNPTVNANDDVLLANATSAAFSIILPLSAAAAGKTVTVKKTNSTTNQVTIARSGNNSIDGATSYALAGQNKYVTLVSDGVGTWYVVANN